MYTPGKELTCHGIALDAVRGVQAEGGLTDSAEHASESTDLGGSDERVNNPAPSLREASR